MPAYRLTGNILSGTAMMLALSLGASVPSASLAQSGGQAQRDVLQLGRNASGESCTATVNWTDAAHGAFTKFRNVYSVNCSGAVTGALARVRLFNSAEARSTASAALQCGASESVTLDGFGQASARRCFDPALGFASVVLDADLRGKMVQISAAPNAIGAGYQAALLLTGLGAADAVTSDRSPINLASLAPLPTGVGAAQADAATREEGDTLLARATSLNFRGLSADASRFLRSELGNLPAATPARTRALLLLEAGLADSNIRFFKSADSNIKAAEAVIRQLQPGEQRALQPRLDTYRGLHALNQRDFVGARKILEPLALRTAARVEGLNDPNALAQLNTISSETGDPRSAIAQPNFDLAREGVLGVQGQWALSVAQLALGNRAGALKAIKDADRELTSLKGSLTGQRLKQDGLYWLDARLVRQLGRVQAENGDFNAAVASFDKAIDLLLPNGGARSFTANDPAVAELKLERASIINRAGKAPKIVEDAYSDALDAMLAAREEGGGVATGLLHPYLDLLAQRMASGDTAAASRYFSALQVAGESSAARQVNELQQIVEADAGIAEKLRLRDGLESRLSALPVEIADARARGDTAEVIAKLQQEQVESQQAFAALDADLASNGRLSQVSERPAELAALQATLKSSGEAYVRLTVMNDRVFGILIERDRATAIRPELSADDLLRMSAAVRGSVAFDLETARVAGFDLTVSRQLYQALFGEVDPLIKRNAELVIDGGRLFSGITAGMLVTDRQSEESFRRQADKSDYSQVAFLAKQASTSVAMSPLSFIASRKFTQSTAPRALLGLAAPTALGDQAIGTDGKVSVGPCRINPRTFAQAINRLSPIASTEIDEVSAALGLAGSPALLSGANFSDSALRDLGKDNGELGNYQILHFATHGVTEGQFGCDDFPAGLLTSLGSEGSDLLLSYDEIAALRLNANLVVMSACETASQVGEGTQQRAGEARPGDTLDGLVRSFFAAGSRAVLATYWETSNSGQSERFMSAFYSAGRDRSITQAINQAQLALLDDPTTSHPFYWAGFFVVGQTDNQMLSGRPATVAAR